MSQTQMRRSANILQIATAMLVFSIIAGCATVGIYFLTGEWQALAVSAVFWIHLLVSVNARRLVRRGRESAAAGWVVSMPLVMVPAVSLFLSGSAVAFAVTLVSVSAVLVGLVIRPGRRGILWGLSVLLGTLVVATASTSWPWQRLDVGGYAVTAAALGPLVIGAVILALWQLLSAYRRLAAIRTRLIVVFIVLVFTVATVLSVVSILMQIQISQQQAFDQLETTVTLKSVSVNSWIDQLSFALESLVVEDYEVQRAQTVLMQSVTEGAQENAAQLLRARFSSLIKRTGWFTEIFLVSTDGEVMLSTSRALEGRNVSDRPYFQYGLDALYLEPPRYDPVADGVTIVLAQPLQFGGTTYGIVAGRTDMAQLTAMMASGELGETGATHLVSVDHMLLTAPVLAGGYVPVHSDGIEAALRQPTGIAHSVYTSHSGVWVSGAQTWLPRLQVALLAEQNQTEIQAGAVTTSLISGGVGLLATLMAIVFALVFSNSISRPLSNLAMVASRVAGGDLTMTAEVAREDEVGAVARAFNGMTSQLRDLVGGLEQRVQERTRGLLAVTEVSRATTSMLDPDELLPQVVELARQRFGLYYVGLFLLDETGDMAVLRAGTGVAGMEMLARDWRLRSGGQSMIGRCVATGEAVTRQQDEDDVVRLDNPWLPETRSELALPLRYGDRVTGAMTVQSAVPNAFGETELAVFQNLADQVAVAVENARLFAETQAALDRARRAQRRYERQQWSGYLGARHVSGYEQIGSSVRSLDRTLLPEAQDALTSGALVSGAPSSGETRDDRHQIVIPITQGDQVIGVLGVQRDAAWSPEETGFVHTLAEQLSLAAENQRLLDVAQRREAVERLTREVASRMREPVELEDVLRTAADEVRKAMGADWVVVRMAESLADDGEE